MSDTTQNEPNPYDALRRSDRNNLLTDSDWRVLPDAPGDRQAWIDYRQALRDLPSDPNWPNVDFPDPPA